MASILLKPMILGPNSRGRVQLTPVFGSKGAAIEDRRWNRFIAINGADGFVSSQSETDGRKDESTKSL